MVIHPFLKESTIGEKLILGILLIRDAFFVLSQIIFVSVFSFLLPFCSASAQSSDEVNLNVNEDFNISNSNGFLKYELRQRIFYDTIDTKSSKEFVMNKSPWTAVALSAVLPGLGQFYNESYWKIPIIGAVGGYFIYEIIRNNNKFLEYRDKYSESQNDTLFGVNPVYKDFREFYRDQRDQFIIYYGLLYLVNLFDAYVDAHLYDFDVSDKVKMGFLKNRKLFKIEYYF